MKNFYKVGNNKKDFKTNWNIYPKLIEILKLNKREKILDAGCGEGQLADFLRGYSLYGVDLSKNAVRKAKKRGYKKAIVGELNNLPFKDKVFDKTISIQVFQYLTDPRGDFKELVRLTKKQIIITVPNFNWLKTKSLFSPKYKKIYLNALSYVNLTNKDFLKNLAKQNNLNVQIKYISNKMGFFRNLFGNLLSSEVVGIYKI